MVIPQHARLSIIFQRSLFSTVAIVIKMCAREAQSSYKFYFICVCFDVYVLCTFANETSPFVTNTSGY